MLQMLQMLLLQKLMAAHALAKAGKYAYIVELELNRSQNDNH